jgi:hypothetical protein
VDGGVVEERELARLHVDLDDADVPGVADERVEDAEVGAVVGWVGRERVVVRRLGGEPAVGRLSLGRLRGGCATGE